MDPQHMNQQSGAPMQTPTAVEAAVEKKSSVGSIIGAVVIIVLIVFGGLYFWGAQLEKRDRTAQDALPFLVGDEEEPADVLPPTSSSNEVSSIESDVNTTDLDAIDAEIDAALNNMGGELQ